MNEHDPSDPAPFPPDPPSGADDVDAVTSAILTVSRLLVAISARSLAAVTDEITVAQFRVLVVVSAEPGRRLADLADRLGVNPSTAMRMADRLTAAGLISKTVNPANRREIIIDVTPEGRRVVAHVTRHRRADIAAIVARMPSHQRTGMVSALQAFTDAGGEPPAEVFPLGWT
jgi:DNA-binding MarR family transcriptional regulator